jgi:hypothetical protein
VLPLDVHPNDVDSRTRCPHGIQRGGCFCTSQVMCGRRGAGKPVVERKMNAVMY